MPSPTPAPTSDATSTRRGLMGIGAQIFSGMKSFLDPIKLAFRSGSALPTGSPADLEGTLIYNTTTKRALLHDGTSWLPVVVSTSGGSAVTLEEHLVSTSAHDSDAIVWAGGSLSWADGTFISPTNVDDAIQAVVGELGSFNGASRVGAEPQGGLSGETVQAQLVELDDEKVGAVALAATTGAASVGAATGGSRTTTTVQGQLGELDANKVASTSLSANTGTTLIGGAAKSGMAFFNLAAGTLKAQLEELLTHINATRPDLETPIQPTLNTNVNHGPNGETFIYMKDGCGYMHVYGSITWGGGGTLNGVICQMAAGRRPSRIVSIKAHAFDPLGFGADALVWAYIDTSGNVQVLGLPSGYICRLAFPSYKAI